MIRSTTSAGSERRHVSVMFSDLSGYTSLSEQLDPEDVQAIMHDVYDAAQRIVTKYGGRIDRLLGDAVMALFGDPVAHEDDAVRAIRAALELHAAVRDLSPRVEAAAGLPMRMHSGINTGLVITEGSLSGGLSTGPLGDTINVAARLQKLAEADEILVGPETRRLTAASFEIQDHGVHRLKGKRGPVEIGRVTGVSLLRHPTPRVGGEFVGRHEELGVLVGAVEGLRDGESSVVSICGEAGTGKTRLVAEFRSRVGEDVNWLEGRAYAYGQTVPYAPIMDLMNRLVGIDDADLPDAVRAKIDRAVGSIVPDSQGLIAPIIALYDLDTRRVPIDRESFRGTLLQASMFLIDSLARSRPVVVCMQDLHWADPSSVWLLRNIIAGVDAPLLTVVNHRPGFDLGVPGARELRLGTLSPRQTRKLLSSLLDGDVPPEGLAEFLDDRTEGNPFFVEEIVANLLETGILTRSPTGWVLTEPLEHADVPTSIRGVISARIDRLDDPPRRVLREASVVGREFLYRVVQRITSANTGLRTSLDDISAADLIRQKASEPDLEYAFKHALTQEVAYDGLLSSERQDLHVAVATAIQAELADRMGEYTEALAHHFERGGVVDKAVHFRALAGRKALERGGIQEADDHYRAAYGLLSGAEVGAARDKVLVELILDWSTVHYYNGTIEELSDLLARHLETAEDVGDLEQLSLWYAWTGRIAFFLHGTRAALPMLDRAVELAERSGSARALAYAHCWRPWVLWVMGENRAAIEARARVADVESQLDDDAPTTWSLACGAIACAQLGDLVTSRQMAQELMDLGRQRGSSRDAGFGHIVLAHVSILSGDVDAAVSHAELAAATAADPWFALLRDTWTSAVLAYGRGDDLEAIRESLERLRSHLVTLGLASDFASPAAIRRLTTPWRFFVITVEAGLLLREGHLSTGWALLSGSIKDATARGELGGALMLEIFMASALARAVTGEVETHVLAALRNPRFTLAHGWRLKREARRRLEELSLRLASERQEGWRFVVELELAKLLVHLGDSKEAQNRLHRALDAIAPLGSSPGRDAALELLASLEG